MGGTRIRFQKKTPCICGVSTPSCSFVLDYTGTEACLLRRYFIFLIGQSLLKNTLLAKDHIFRSLLSMYMFLERHDVPASPSHGIGWAGPSDRESGCHEGHDGAGTGHDPIALAGDRDTCAGCFQADDGEVCC